MKHLNNKGISLIVLVITIIVMIILATAIILSLNSSNIVNKAKEATLKTSHAAVKQSLVLIAGDYQLENSSNKSTFMDFLTTKGYVDTNGVINMTKLASSEGNIGNGAGDSDVYKIETNDTSYLLNYYDAEGTKNELFVILPLEAPAKPDTTGPDVVITGVANDRNGVTIVNLNITNIVDTDYPITVKYSLIDFNDSSVVYECYTDTIMSSTGGSYTSTYDYLSKLNEYGSMGYALVEVTDASGNVSKIKYSNGNDYSSDAFLVNISGCFAAGTQVLTVNGLKNIEDIKIGEKVYAVDLNTNEKVLSVVLKTHSGTTNEKYNIHVGDELVVSSPEHMFYVENKGWIKACELKQGDTLVSKNGENANITKIECIRLKEPLIVYNLTVAEYENFLITDNELLVHNIAK